MGQRCVEMTARGALCKSWAVRGTDPPRCASHGGTEKKPGAPVGNVNAKRHGFYQQITPDPGGLVDIDAIIADLAEKQVMISAYISECRMDPDPEANLGKIAHMFVIHGQNASRLGRLLRDKRAISGEAADGIAGAIAKTLAELGTEWGTDLIGDL